MPPPSPAAADHGPELVYALGGRGAATGDAVARAAWPPLPRFYFATFPTHRLAPGELGIVPVLAPGTRQAKVIFDYAFAFLQASAVLRKEIASVTAT